MREHICAIAADCTVLVRRAVWDSRNEYAVSEDVAESAFWAPELLLHFDREDCHDGILHASSNYRSKPMLDRFPPRPLDY